MWSLLSHLDVSRSCWARLTDRQTTGDIFFLASGAWLCKVNNNASGLCGSVLTT